MTQSLTKHTLLTQWPALYRLSLPRISSLTGKPAHPVSRPGNVHFPRNRATMHPRTTAPLRDHIRQPLRHPATRNRRHPSNRLQTALRWPNAGIRPPNIQIEQTPLTDMTKAIQAVCIRSQRSYDHSKVTPKGNPSPHDRLVTHDHPSPVRINNHHNHHETHKKRLVRTSAGRTNKLITLRSSCNAGKVSSKSIRTHD